MGEGATQVRIAAVGIAATAAMLLSACSMAGLPIKPRPAQQPTSVAAAVESTPSVETASAMAVLSYADPAPRQDPLRGPAAINTLIEKYAGHYGVPTALVHRVVAKESNYRPAARNGPNWGLMQIRYDTARSMGYRGDPEGLLDPDTNLRYAVKYLRGAYVVGGYSQDAAVRLYQRGYYYDAKTKNLLDEVGLR